MQTGKKPKTRGEKIKLLHAIRDGKISVRDIIGEPVTIWYTEGDNYKHFRTNQVLSREEFEKESTTGINLVFVPAEGCEPIKE